LFISNTVPRPLLGNGGDVGVALVVGDILGSNLGNPEGPLLGSRLVEGTAEGFSLGLLSPSTVDAVLGALLGF
jgi:hypothetical protein